MELIKGLGGTFVGVGTPLDQWDVPPTGPKALSTAVAHGQGLGKVLSVPWDRWTARRDNATL
jgi:hypothetical protein